MSFEVWKFLYDQEVADALWFFSPLADETLGRISNLMVYYVRFSVKEM